MQRCEECGFEYESVAPAEIGATIRRLAGEVGGELLDRSTRERIGTRPAPAVWSGLEYGCHVRDVVLAQRERILLALVEERPSFAPIYRDHRVTLAGYDDETPEDVATHLDVAAALMAHVVDRLTEEQFARTCVYNYPAPTERDVAWVGRHTVHEVSHHLADIRSVLARTAAV